MTRTGGSRRRHEGSAGHQPGVQKVDETTSDARRKLFSCLDFQRMSPVNRLKRAVIDASGCRGCGVKVSHRHQVLKAACQPPRHDGPADHERYAKP